MGSRVPLSLRMRSSPRAGAEGCHRDIEPTRNLDLTRDGGTMPMERVGVGGGAANGCVSQDSEACRLQQERGWHFRPGAEVGREKKQPPERLAREEESKD